MDCEFYPKEKREIIQRGKRKRNREIHVLKVCMILRSSLFFKLLLLLKGTLIIDTLRRKTSVVIKSLTVKPLWHRTNIKQPSEANSVGLSFKLTSLQAWGRR